MDRRRADHGRLNALLGLAEAQSCRRQTLLGYFGETAEPCGNCDLCDSPPALFDATTPVRMALSAILRTQESFGAGHLIDILTGTLTDRVRERGHDGLPTFAVGRDWTKPQWTAIFRQMMGHDLIRPDPERHGALVMTDAAVPILKGAQPITLRRDALKVAAVRPVVKTLVHEEDAPLLSALKAKRRALAEQQGMPAYIVFPDRTLIEMAERRPTTLDQMAAISGVGAKKLESYGAAFLAVITGAQDQTHPLRRKLAGRDAGAIFDRLQEVQAGLARGACGTLKPLSCNATTLRQIAERRPSTLPDMERLPGMGPQKVERFGPAFLDVLADAG